MYRAVCKVGPEFYGETWGRGSGNRAPSPAGTAVRWLERMHAIVHGGDWDAPSRSKKPGVHVGLHERAVDREYR